MTILALYFGILSMTSRRILIIGSIMGRYLQKNVNRVKKLRGSNWPFFRLNSNLKMSQKVSSFSRDLLN